MIKQAYGEEAFDCSAVFKWHKRFAQGRDSLEYDEHTGQRRTIRTELKIREVAMVVCANCSQTIDFFKIPFYLQAVQIHSANGVKLLEA
jgi:hypothetical protein